MSNQELEPLLVRAGKAAKSIGVSMTTWRKWRAQGETPPERKFGKFTYVSYSDLKDFAANLGVPLTPKSKG